MWAAVLRRSFQFFGSRYCYWAESKLICRSSLLGKLTYARKHIPYSWIELQRVYFNCKIVSAREWVEWTDWTSSLVFNNIGNLAFYSWKCLIGIAFNDSAISIVYRYQSLFLRSTRIDTTRLHNLSPGIIETWRHIVCEPWVAVANQFIIDRFLWHPFAASPNPLSATPTNPPSPEIQSPPIAIFFRQFANCQFHHKNQLYSGCADRMVGWSAEKVN